MTKSPEMMRNIIDAEDFDILVEAVEEEILRAEGKFENWPLCPIIGASIMMEEAGEAVRAANHYGFGPSDEKRKALRMELIQTAAMCFRMLNAL